MKFIAFFSALLLATATLPALTPAITGPQAMQRKAPVTGADQTAQYLPYLKGKRIGMLVNQTSIIGNKLSVDSLVSLGVKIVKG